METIGEKIRLARTLAGYTITDLANEIGISKQSMSQYENGVEPKIDIYFKLLNALHCKKEFLEKDFSNKVTIKNTFFRALAAATATERRNQESKTTLVIHLYQYLLEYLDMPKLNIPYINEELSIEEKAEYLRQYWKLDNKPIKNMVNVLERNGVIVSTFNADMGNRGKYSIDGYTQQFALNERMSENHYCVIVENNKASLARKNFSLAHELGHIILHGAEEYAQSSKTEQNRIESEANTFASAFLMPRSSFGNDVARMTCLNDYIWLKRQWYVSIAAMMMRAKSLNIIDADEYLRLVKQYSYRKYRTLEPLDQELGTYKPTLFKTGIELLFKNGMTLQRFEKELADRGIGLPLSNIEEILGLDKGFFDKYKVKDKIISINFKKEI